MSALERAFAQWQTATSEHERARLALLAAIRKAHEQGQSQAEIAQVLGWPRQRVHEALK